MDNASYTTLTRQSGLMREMQSVANNIANASTTGFRREGVVFSEHVADLDSMPSLSMARAGGHHIDTRQGGFEKTGGPLDLAIEGDGYFMVETPDGDRLTRAGHFMSNSEGDLVTADGFRVLDAGGAPVFVPPNATSISIAADGTMSADGDPVTQLGLFTADPSGLVRVGSTLFEASGGVEPLIGGTVLQGFLEGSNVDPVTEIARMIEVQRSYELGQKFLEKEDERLRSVQKLIGR